MNEKGIIPPRLMRQLFVLVALIILGLLILTPLLPYISAIFGAIIMYVLTKGLMRYLVEKGFKRWIAAILMILLTIVVILVPSLFIIFLLTNKVQEAMRDSDRYLEMFTNNITRLNDYVGFDITQNFDGAKAEQIVTNLIRGAAGSLLDFTIIIGLLYFILYYLLINYDRIKEVMRRYMPLNHENFEIVTAESEEMVKSNAIAIPLVAVLQGCVALLGFWVFDAPNIWFWFAVTTVGSMIPFIGTALGMVPVILIMYAQGLEWQAGALALYGLVIVGSMDNIFRIFVQKSLAKIHPMITLIGVIIGLPLFGFFGLVFGPVIVSLFLVMAKIYKKEYGQYR